jgi:hypothetical protein
MFALSLNQSLRVEKTLRTLGREMDGGTGPEDTIGV